MKSCRDCKYMWFQDYGYSNYTVEGTDAECGRGVHPSGGFDRFYGEAEQMKHAEQCEHYVERDGEVVHIDVDGYDRPADGSWEDGLVRGLYRIGG